MSELAFEMKDICKSFSGTQVLFHVDFSCHVGEIRCLAGENGAGKSTLLKILSGLYQADHGQILIDGRECRFKSPADSQQAGITMVYQELTLIPSMTAAENIWLNMEFTKNLGFLDRKAMLLRTKELMRQYEMDFDITVPVSTLSIANQQMTEILKALVRDTRIMIFDEPTSSLSNTEVAKLFQIMRKMASNGKTIIFISHRMKEVFEISDSVTVMKDGVLSGTVPVKEIDEAGLIRMMVGRTLDRIFPPKKKVLSDQVLFEASDISAAGKIHDISFEVHKGEILGIAGLDGHGQTELLNTIAGVIPRAKGTIRIEGKEIHGNTSWEAIKDGISLVPSDRKTEGLCLKMSVLTNLTMIESQRYRKGLLVDGRRERQYAEDAVKKLMIKVHDINGKVENLSGGNQQKVVLGKELAIHPRVLLFIDPTKGIDIEAKSEFYNIMRNLADEGVVIILSSSDMIELTGICDKLIVMYEGHISGSLQKEAMTEENIMRLALGLQ